MNIAVHTRQPVGDDLNVLECFLELASIFPLHRFIFFSGTDSLGNRSLPPNTTIEVAPQPTGSFLQRPFAYHHQMRSLLKKYRADVLVCTGGSRSIRTKLPQYLVISGLCFLDCPALMNKGHLRFHQKNLPRVLKQACSIAAFSESIKSYVTSNYPVDENRILVLTPPVTGNFGPLDPGEKHRVREQYADGKEYFLFTGSSSCGNNLVNLLKAFSFFKKRQKTNMLLLMHGIEDRGSEEGTGLLKTFRFRDEVKLMGPLSPVELARITASAYAFVQPFRHEDCFIDPILAMKCEVPVILGDNPSRREICGDAALYAAATDYRDIAEKMMTLFRDERMCRELTNEGIKKTGKYGMEKSPGLWWQWITGAIEMETA